MSPWLAAAGRIGVGVAVVASLAAVAVAVATYDDPIVVGLGLLSVLALSVVIVGSAAIRAAPRNAVSWILLAAGVALPVAMAAFGYARAAYVDGVDLPGASVAAWLDGWPWIPAMLLVPTIGVLLFPDGRLPSPRWRPLLVIQIVLAGVLLLATLFEEHSLDYSDRDNLTALPGSLGDVATGAVVSIALVAPLAVLSAVAFEQRRRAADGTTLDTVRLAVWTIAGSWVACLVIGAAGGDTLAALPAEAVGMAALGVSCWVAIRQHGLFDARLAVRRGLVYSALTALVMIVYAVTAALLTGIGAEHLATPVALAAGVVIALPLRDRLQRLANRLVFGVREDPYSTLIRLGEQLEPSSTGTDALTNAARTLHETLGVEHVAIEVAGDVMAESGPPVDGEHLDVPLAHGGERVGTMRVTTGLGRSLGADRRNLLDGIARQMATAVRATSLARDLVNSRERLVTATEDERRRLRRDLHDGLGPALSSAVLSVGRAQSLLGRDPAAAARQLEQLSAQIQDAVADVRRLVYGLRPPALDELGLVGALDQQAQNLGGITVVGPRQPVELSAAVEVAAYRIATEAMTNAVRHSHAQAVTVDVYVDGQLRLEIADDGIGLPDGYRAGVGISSMRERAAELGGDCVVQRRNPRGTLVRARVPLEEP